MTSLFDELDAAVERLDLNPDDDSATDDFVTQVRNIRNKHARQSSGNAFHRDEVDSIYVYRTERYVVSLIVGYSDEDLRAEDPGRWVGLSSEEQAREAARWALELTRDDGANGTHWFVYDREEKVMRMFEQDEFDPEMERFGEGLT